MQKKAFTLMELMIVIVIIGILSTVGMVMFGGQSEKAKKTVAAKNYSQIINFIQTESALCEFYESNKILAIILVQLPIQFLELKAVGVVYLETIF